MNIEYNPRIEIGNFINFIADKKGIPYFQAEKLVPAMYFEDCSIGSDEEGDWCKEVVEYLKENNIKYLEVYQDC